MLKEKIKNLKKGLKSDGLEYFLSAVSSMCPEWLFRYYHTYLITAKDIKLITREYKDYSVRFATPDDIEIMEPVINSRDIALHRLKRGDSCVIVLKGEEVVSISWAATGRLFNRYAGSIVETGEDGYFLYGVYSIPRERLKGFFASCFKLQIEHYEARGKTIKYGVIEALNRNSIKTHLRLGFENIGETYSMTILGLSFCYYKRWPNQERKLHLFFRRPPENLEWV